MPLSNDASPHSSSTWRNKFFDFYLWCKVFSVSLNIMYMIKTFEKIYDAGSSIAHQQITGKYTVPLQYGFQVLIGCLMMFCLIIDLVVLTTSKLAIANWYWRPGVFFFTFTCGIKLIALTDLLLNNESFFQNCQQRLTGIHSPIILVSELCSIQNRLNHIFTITALFRDVLVCGGYVTVAYFYILLLVQILKRADSSDTAMHVMANSYHYPITQ